MSYAARNTLFIAAFWALIMALGLFFVYSYQDKKIEALNSRIAHKQSRIDDLHKMRYEMDSLLEDYNHLKELSLGKMGTLAGNESPGETYDYIRRELIKTSSSLSINFTYNGEERQVSSYKRRYQIDGNGKFTDLYCLIWFLEHGPIFYDIRSLNVDAATHEDEEIKSNNKEREITFEMMVWGFSKDEGVEMEAVNRTIKDPDPIAELVSNSMRKRLSFERVTALQTQQQALSKPEATETPQQSDSAAESVPIQSNLPVISQKSRVLAITPTSCIIQDDNGRQWRLGVGDEIEQGVLEDIQNQSGKVIFRLRGARRSELIELSTNP